MRLSVVCGSWIKAAKWGTGANARTRVYDFCPWGETLEGFGFWIGVSDEADLGRVSSKALRLIRRYRAAKRKLNLKEGVAHAH